MKFRSWSLHTTDVEGVEVELDHVPCDWLDSHTCKIGERVIVAYNVSDHDCWRSDDLLGDCMGRIVDAHNGRDAEKRELYALAGCDRYGDKDLDAVWDRHQAEAIRRYVDLVVNGHSDEDTVTEYEERDSGYARREGETLAETARRYVTEDAEGVHYWSYVMQDDDMQTVLGEMWEEPEFCPGDPNAVMLDVYDHSGQRWSISGGGMQCRWDTSRGAGAWVPDKYLLDQIESDVAQGKDRRAQCRLYAKQFLDTYNDIISGNVYGCVVQVHDLEGEQLSQDDCWGFIGTDHAEESLLDEFYNPAVEEAKKVWDQRLVELGITVEASWYVVAWMDGTQREVMKFDDLDAAVEFAKEKQHEHA